MDELNRLNELEERLTAISSTDEELKTLGTFELRRRNEELTAIYNETNEIVDGLLNTAVNGEGYSLQNIANISNTANNIIQRLLGERRTINTELRGKENLWVELRDKYNSVNSDIYRNNNEITRINNEINELNAELSTATDDIRKTRFEGLIKVNEEAVKQLEERNKTLLEEKNSLKDKIRIVTNGGNYPEVTPSMDEEKNLNEEMDKNAEDLDSKKVENNETPITPENPVGMEFGPKEDEENKEVVPIPVPLPGEEGENEEVVEPIDDEDSLELPPEVPTMEDENEENDLGEDLGDAEVVPEEEEEKEEPIVVPVDNVVQPKPTLWQKFKTALKNAGLFILTIAGLGTAVHTGIMAHRIGTYEESNHVDPTPTPGDKDEEEDKQKDPTPTPTPSNPGSGEEDKQKDPTPTPTPSNPGNDNENDKKDPTPSNPSDNQGNNPGGNTGEDKKDPTVDDKNEPVLELATEGESKGEVAYNEKTGVEVTSTGDAYLHDENGNTTVQEDRDLNATDHGTVEVTKEDFEPDKVLPEVPKTGEERPMEEVMQDNTVPEEDKQNLEDAVLNYDFSQYFDQVESNERQP